MGVWPELKYSAQAGSELMQPGKPNPGLLGPLRSSASIQASMMFPVLKKGISVREEPNGALLLTPAESTFELLSPFEAFLILAFDGQHSISDVASMLVNMKSRPELSHVEHDVLKFVQANRHVLNVHSTSLPKKRSSLDPFIFLRKDDLFTRPKRCSTPLGVTLYLTRRCNLNCAYCFADARYYKKDNLTLCETELDTDSILRIVDELHAINVTNVTVTGGEVTLRPDLSEIVSSLIGTNIDVDLATNACLIDERVAGELWDAGLRRMQVKLDAVTPSIQNHLTRKKGSHTQLINGIKLVANFGFSVSVACVLTSANATEVGRIFKFCENLGVANVSFRIYEPGIWALHGRGDASLNLGSDAIIKIAEKVDEIRRNRVGRTNVEPLKLSQFTKKEEASVPSCSGMISTCTVLENGVVSACEMLADFSEQFVFGSVRDATLIDIWNSDKANEWVSRKSTFTEPCLSCKELDRCKGGCPWKAMVAYGKWLCDPQCVKAPQWTALPRSKL